MLALDAPLVIPLFLSSHPGGLWERSLLWETLPQTKRVGRVAGPVNYWSTLLSWKPQAAHNVSGSDHRALTSSFCFSHGWDSSVPFRPLLVGLALSSVCRRLVLGLPLLPRYLQPCTRSCTGAPLLMHTRVQIHTYPRANGPSHSMSLQTCCT